MSNKKSDVGLFLKKITYKLTSEGYRGKTVRIALIIVLSLMSPLCQAKEGILAAPLAAQESKNQNQELAKNVSNTVLAIKQCRKEQKKEMEDWRIKNPNANTIISFVAGAAVGGFIATMVSLGAVGIWGLGGKNS